MSINQANKRAHPRPWRHRTELGDPMMSAVVDKWGTLIAGSFICRQTNKETVASHALIVSSVNLVHAMEGLGISNHGKTFIAAEFLRRKEGK